MSPTVATLISFFTGYLAGSIPFGYLAGRMKGVDLRHAGSGNIGATNAGRVLGLRWFFIVFLCDVLKGFLPVSALQALNLSMLDTPATVDVALICGIGALAGHSFPVWLAFRGGKAVATGLGVLLALHPAAAGISAGVFVLVLAVTRYVSAGSVVASIAAPAVFWMLEGSGVLESQWLGRWMLFVAAALFISWRHRGNLARIARGTEPKIGAKHPSASGTPS